MTSLRNFLEEKKYQRISLKKLSTGHYKLKVKVNNIYGDFILDTGASTSCIGYNSIHHFNLIAEASNIKAAGAGTTNMETQISNNNLLELAKKKTIKVSFVLFDLSHINIALAQEQEPSVHGILGADLLKKYASIIDYGRNCLFIK